MKKRILWILLIALTSISAVGYSYYLQSHCLVTLVHPGRVEVWTEVYYVPNEDLASTLAARLEGKPFKPETLRPDLRSPSSTRVWEGNIYETKSLRLKPGKYFIIGL